MRQHNIQLVREHNHVKESCEELRRVHEEDQREVADMRLLHQQVYQYFYFYMPTESTKSMHRIKNRHTVSVGYYIAFHLWMLLTCD